MVQKIASGKRPILHLVELLLLAVTLLATVVISSLTLQQTTKHFKIERTSTFVARFNSVDMVKVRDVVDKWIKNGPSPAELYSRSNLQAAPGSAARDSQIEHGEKLSPSETLAYLRTMANFFQELGTALDIGSLDEVYAHQLLGALCVRYIDALGPFIEEARRQMGRPQLYEEAISLRDHMRTLDEER